MLNSLLGFHGPGLSEIENVRGEPRASISSATPNGLGDLDLLTLEIEGEQGILLLIEKRFGGSEDQRSVRCDQGLNLHIRTQTFRDSEEGWQNQPLPLRMEV